MRRTCLLVAFASLLSPSAIAQQDFSNVEVKATKVAGTVYMLTGAGGNIGASVGEDGIVIVDDQYAPLAPRIREALRSISDRPIKFIINTHYHGDHTGGNAILGREAPVVAHENVRKRLQTGTTRLGQTVPPSEKDALPVVTFDNTATIHVNGEDIRAVHTPHGHTDGDSIIYFTQSNVVHMGDDFFNGRFPFIDVENGGSVKGVIAAVENVLTQVRPDTKIIPGHGDLGDPAALRAYLDMLKGSSAAVQKAVKAGKSLEQTQKDKVLAAWDKWTWGFITTDKFTEVLYNDLKKKPTAGVKH